MEFLGPEVLAFMAPPEGADPAPAWTRMMPLVIMMVMLYLVLIRPQQKRNRDHQNLLEKLKVGDKVVTTGGIVGTVVSLKDKNVAIRSADTKMEILKSAISEVTEKNPS